MSELAVGYADYPLTLEILPRLRFFFKHVSLAKDCFLAVRSERERWAKMPSAIKSILLIAAADYKHAKRGMIPNYPVTHSIKAVQ